MTEQAMHLVPVALDPAPYEIVIGSGVVAQAGARIAPLLARPFAVIVTDEIVAGLHLEALKGSLDQAGIAVETIVLPAGEATKSLANMEAVCARLAELRVERRDTLIALGGGVIGDLTGFVAAVMLRGMHFVQIPTTLLAQVDSSVGGKTGVNLTTGKNLVGAFHQPRLVLADIDVLDTLPKRDYLAGYAEVVKYGALGDAGFFEWLSARGDAILARDKTVLAEAVRRSCVAKADIVAQDERESGVRALLNLGHTFGHALEALAGYDGRVLHGEAVAVGMVLAFDLSARLRLAPQEDGARLRDHLSAVGLPTKPSAFDVAFSIDGLMDAMTRDKKVSGGKVTFILAKTLGDAFVARDVEMDRVAETLAAAGIPGVGAAQTMTQGGAL